MGSRGPEATKINWDEFYKLLTYQLTQIEIAHFFNISVDTLDRCCQRDLGEKLADIWDKRKAYGRVRLRKIQFDIAEGRGPGAATMAIFLDKRMFGEQVPFQDAPPGPLASAHAEPAIKSFEEFCRDAHYFVPLPKQCEMFNFGFNETDPRLVLGARGYGKTDYITIMGVAYDIYINRGKTTNLIITKSRERNSAIIDEIAKAIELNGVELEAQNKSRIRVKGLIGKDHSVEAITIKSSIRGRHPKRIIMDDPVTDEDVSEAMRKLVKRKYNEAMKLCSNIVVIGQPAHQYDLYSELRGLVKTMLLPYGTIPELDHDLDAQRLAGVDESSIQASYFLNVVTDGQTPFTDINYIDDFPEKDSVAFLDPSEGGDYSALSCVTGLMDGFAVQGHSWKKAWYHCLDEIVEILVKRRVKKLWFETNCTGDQPIGQLRTLLAPHGIGVAKAHSDTNKHAVIMAAGAYAHLIHLSRTSGKDYVDHVVKYEYKAKFDDAPDSLARCLERLGFIKGKK